MGSDLDLIRRQTIALLSAWSEERYCAGWDQGFIDGLRGSGGIWAVIEEACEGWPQGYRGEDGWEAQHGE